MANAFLNDLRTYIMDIEEEKNSVVPVSEELKEILNNYESYNDDYIREVFKDNIKELSDIANSINLKSPKSPKKGKNKDENAKLKQNILIKKAKLKEVFESYQRIQKSSPKKEDESTLSKRIRRFGKDDKVGNEDDGYSRGSYIGGSLDVFKFKNKKRESKRRLPTRKNY